jgi:prefoldin subunit 5
MRSPWVTALFHSLNPAMLTLAILAGLVAAWWLFPVGLVLWLVMVARIATDRRVRLDYDMNARSGTLSARWQEQYAKVIRSQMRIFNSLMSAGGRTKAALDPVQAELENLTDRVYSLCRQMTGPENFVKVSTMNVDLEGERALIKLSLESAADPLVKREKEEALHALDDRIKKLKKVSTLLDRVEAQLDSMATTMDAILADIVRLQAMGGAQAAREAPQIVRQIRSQCEQVEEFAREAATFS